MSVKLCLSRRHTAASIALLGTLWLIGCAPTESSPGTAVASSPLGKGSDEASSAESPEGYAPQDETGARASKSMQTGRSGQDVRVAARHPEVRGKRGIISASSLILTLSNVPAELRKTPLTDPAWQAWVQGVVGDRVQVTGLRALHAGHRALAAANAQLVVAIAPTAEEHVLAARAHVSETTTHARAETDPIWTSDSVPNDPQYGNQWQWPKIQAPQAWDVANGSPNVTVAVIDSGVDVTHPDLAGAIWNNPFESADAVDNDGNGLVDDVHGWNFLNNNADLADSTGHGTHVAGLIGALRNNAVGIAGIASGVKIMPIVVGSAPPASAVASAIYYAADHGAKIINMSFGGPETFSGARAAIDYATARGVLLVGSAGNHSNDEYNYPAVYQDVIAVAATNSNDQRATLSNYGRWVDIAAPGQDILSTFSNNGMLYYVISGTSQAAPIVAGVAALIKSLHPEFTATQIRNQLLATADDSNPINPDYIGQLGAGRVNAARAVGAIVSSPRAYVAGINAAETTGDGDRLLGPGETAEVTVALHFTAGGTSATARLASTDSYVSVTNGTATFVGPKADRSLQAKFQIRIASSVPLDYQTNLQVTVDGSATVTPIKLPIVTNYRKVSIPFAYEQALVPHPSGRLFFAADDSRDSAPKNRVYAAFRNADGSFAKETTLSDTSNNASKPKVVIDPNGDIHVAFYQSVQSLDFAAFPSYSNYVAATGQWTTTLLTNAAQIRTSKEHNIALARDPNGKLHMAWGAIGDQVALMEQVNGVWSTPSFVAFPAEPDSGNIMNEDLQFLTVGNRLKLFVHPIPSPAFGGGLNATYNIPVQMLEYDGTAWSAPVVLSVAGGTENAQLPFLYAGSVRRFFQPAGTTNAAMATLSGHIWGTNQNVRDVGSTDFRTGFGGLLRADGTYVTMLARPYAVTTGSKRELWVGGVQRSLAGDTTLRAETPVLFDQAGTLHVFNQEKSLYRVLDSWYFYPVSTSYYTTAPLAASARPSTPVVTDDGTTTADKRSLHASWSSSHSTGIAYYRVAWGTAPGKADLLPWTITTATSGNFDLADQRLLPGQTAYISVEARSNAVLSSAIGASDGITLTTQCSASPWNASIAYQDPGTLVTFSGATYRSLYWNSNNVPTTPNGAWQYVEACAGQPALLACMQPAWIAGRNYPAGARVSYRGAEFVAQWATNLSPTGANGNPWKWVINCQ